MAKYQVLDDPDGVLFTQSGDACINGICPDITKLMYKNGTVFFDRGFAESVWYLHLTGAAYRELLTAIEQMKPSRVTPSPVVTSEPPGVEFEPQSATTELDNTPTYELLEKMSPCELMAFSRGCDVNAQTPLSASVHGTVNILFALSEDGDDFDRRDWAFNLAKSLLLALISEQTGIISEAEAERRNRDRCQF